jgi:NADH dehydrogenase
MASSEHAKTQTALERIDGSPRTPHVVIVGGGFGGIQTAVKLRKAPVQVTVVDRNNHHLFQPLLYQVASAVLSPGDIAEPIRGVLRKQKNSAVLLAEVGGVDLEARRVRCGDRWLEYDYLVLAAGVKTSYFGHDEWADAAPGLKTLNDALEIRRRILMAFERAEWSANPDERRRLLTFVVVGGGPTGVELVGALSEIARQALLDDFRNIDPSEARVVLVEGNDRILSSFPGSLPDKALRALHKVGVEVRLGERVTRLDHRGVVVGTEEIEAETVLWAAGVRAEAIGGKLEVPLDRSGRVIVEDDLSIPGHPEVFVIGDLAHFEHGRSSPLPGVAQVALQMGACAAKNIRRTLSGKERKSFRYKDLGSMATIGRSRAIAVVFGLKLSGTLAWLVWLFVHLLALVGFRNRLVVLTQWAWSYFTYERNSRLIRSPDDDTDSVM